MTGNEEEVPERAVPVLEQADVPVAKGERSVRLAGIAVSLAVSCAVATTTMFAYDHWFAQKIVAVDMKGFITLQRYRYKDGKMSDEELRRSFDRLEEMMNAIPKNRVVIMADTAIRNVEFVKLGHEEELRHYEELLRRSLQGNAALQEQ